MRATTIHGTRDIRVTDVPDPAISAPDRRDRQDRRRLHLRLGPVAVPRRQRRSRPATRSGTSASASSRRSGADVDVVPPRRLRDRAVRPLRQHLPALPGRRPGGLRQPGLHRERAGRVHPGQPGRGQPREDRRHARRRAGPVAADAGRRDADRLARRGLGRRPPGRYGGRGRRRRGRAVRRARRPLHGCRADRSRCRATSRARRSPGPSAPPHVVAERDRSGVAAIMEITEGSGPTPCSSASAPTSP